MTNSPKAHRRRLYRVRFTKAATHSVELLAPSEYDAITRARHRWYYGNSEGINMDSGNAYNWTADLV